MDSSEEMDTFTIEYQKILKQLPSMLQPSSPIPQHLQPYIKSNKSLNESSKYMSSKSSKSSKRHHRHKSRHKHRKQVNNSHNIQPITSLTSVINHREHPYITYSDDETSPPNLLFNDNHNKHHRHQRKRSKSISSSFSSKRDRNKSSKYQIQNVAYNVFEKEDKDKDNDVITIEELKKINEMLSKRKIKQNKLKIDKKKEISQTIQKEQGIQTEEIKKIPIVAKPKPKSVSISVQTEKVNNMPITGTKMSQLIEKLTKELNEKSTLNSSLSENNKLLENDLKVKSAKLISINTEISSFKQQICDQNIYCRNLIKHLDEKSRNESLLRKEIQTQQKQLKDAHLKLQQFFSPKANKNEILEIKNLRNALILSEEKIRDWKNKYQTKCVQIEQLESDKIMNQHRLDKQLNEYQKIISDFREIMKNNLNSVNDNFSKLNTENILLKNENEKLLFEIGKIQENTFKKDKILLNKNQKNKENKQKKENKIIELTNKLTEFEENLKNNHLNGKMDKAIQSCIINENEMNEYIYNELDDISINLYKLTQNLQTKTEDIIHEYGFNSLTNSPNNNKNNNNNVNMDYGDIDNTSIIVNCKKRFFKSTQILKQLSKWIDDIIFKQAEKQCDNCITQ